MHQDSQQIGFRGRCLDESGNAAAEYAIVVGVVLIAVLSLGNVVCDTVFQSTALLAEPLDPGSAARDSDESANELAIASESPVARYQQAILPFVLVLSVGVSCLTIGRILKSKKPDEEGPKQAPDEKYYESQRYRINAILRSQRNSLADWSFRVEHVMQRLGSASGVTVSGSKVSNTSGGQASNWVVSVRDQSGEVIGKVSEQDFELSGIVAIHAMPDELVAIDAKSTLSAAIGFMQNSGVEVLPVASNGAVVGMLTRDDLLTTLTCVMQLISEIDDEYRLKLRRAVGVEG